MEDHHPLDQRIEAHRHQPLTVICPVEGDHLPLQSLSTCDASMRTDCEGFDIVRFLCPYCQIYHLSRLYGVTE